MLNEDADKAALATLMTTGDIASCVATFHRMLFALVHRYPFPDPEEAVYLALLDVQQCGAGSISSVLPARIWVLGMAKQRFDQLLRDGE